MAVKHFQFDSDLEPTGFVTREVYQKLDIASRKA
jgi:hypothetical protein